MSSLNSRVSSGFMQAGAEVPLKNYNHVDGLGDMLGFIDHAAFDYAVRATVPACEGLARHQRIGPKLP